MQILDRWCAASGAKFNKEKTEIIPIGTLHYREELIRTRKPTPESNELPNHIHIAKDGEAMCILGAWYRNEMDNAVIC